MLIYFVTRQHRYTIDTFLDTWGASLKSKVRVTHYEDAADVRYKGVATVIFSDYDRLSSEHRAGFGALCDSLIERGIRVLNHPQQSLRRSDLLEQLYQAGINSYRAYLGHQVPVEGATPSLKFPVFVRFANEHSGPQSPLIHSHEKLKNAIAVGQKKGVPLHEMLVVEFCSTIGADGLYRKYSSFYVDGQVVPRHMIASTEWALRMPDLITPELQAQEREYLESNPHSALVRRVFEMAKVGYGRIDYALHEGKPQVWEINPNPYLMLLPEKYKPEQMPNQQWFAPRIVDLFEGLLRPHQ